MSGLQFTRPQSIGLSGLGQYWMSLVTSGNQSQKNYYVFKDALQVILSALPEKAINSTVNDFRKRVQACVSANGRQTR